MQYRIPTILVTSLVLAAALISLAAQYNYTARPDIPFGLIDSDQNEWLSLWILSGRATELRSVTDPIEREKMCIANSSVGRSVDKYVPHDARVFVSGVLGKEGAGASAMYLFLQNYLFPREIQISLDGRAICNGDGFSGVPCDSPEILRTNGFDFQIQVLSAKSIAVLPLNKKWVEP